MLIYLSMRNKGRQNDSKGIDLKRFQFEAIKMETIIGLIYPEKLTIDVENFKTSTIKSFVNTIFLINGILK
ncbi:hypothetical protein [Epilithonimonas sp.]|uniref:hypothetical protein n=1 Tax=Epilithonimonas sp. TaxID=2894511 RepID=UPI0028994E4D|nr:hypothetical protein [Epilithonimonas sp.]